MRRLPFLLLLTLSAGCGGRVPVPTPVEAELKSLPPGTHQKVVAIPDVGDMKVTLDVPAGYDGNTPVPLVLALHYGYRGDRPAPYTGRGMIEAFRPGLSGLHAIVLAPDVLGGRWTDARNEEAAVWLTKRAMEEYAIDDKKVVITGFSMGGQGTWFIGSRHQDLFTGAIPVAARFAGEEEGWTIPVYVIHSDNDTVVSYSAAKKHAEAVKSKGAKLEFKTVSGLGHFQTGAYASHVGDALKWLQAEWEERDQRSTAP